MKVDTSQAKFTAISRQVSPNMLLGVSVGNCQRAVVYEPEIIGTQIGTHNWSEMVVVL
jgi:hypothetical protein